MYTDTVLLYGGRLHKFPLYRTVHNTKITMDVVPRKVYCFDDVLRKLLQATSVTTCFLRCRLIFLHNLRRAFRLLNMLTFST
jgi:hypothetical protein